MELVVARLLPPLLRFGSGEAFLPVGLEPIRRGLRERVISHPTLRMLIARSRATVTHLERAAAHFDLLPRCIPEPFVLVLPFVPFSAPTGFLHPLRFRLDETEQDVVFLTFPFCIAARSATTNSNHDRITGTLTLLLLFVLALLFLLGIPVFLVFGLLAVDQRHDAPLCSASGSVTMRVVCQSFDWNKKRRRRQLELVPHVVAYDHHWEDVTS